MLYRGSRFHISGKRPCCRYSLFFKNSFIWSAKYLAVFVVYCNPSFNLERDNAIAVSVRNFRVAGIRGIINSDEVLTIQTAVQIAVQYQTRGLEAQAEQIYRSILQENPMHPDALHLLGVIYYQKGDAISAIPFVERAMQSNKSFEGFHNTLGILKSYCITYHTLYI